MTTQVDALQSFTHLVDNIPQWLTRLDDLLAKCETQYERFTRITQRGEVKLTRKKKQASTESLRPGNEEETLPIQPAIMTPEATTKRPLALPCTALNSTHATNTTTNQEIPRKRRAGSDLSGAPSNHCRYHTKNMVIVFYDSDIQEGFETLVKSIAGARNNLRKGKNAASFKIRMAGMEKFASGLDKSNDRMEDLALDPKILATPSLAKTRLGRHSVASELKCFEDADHQLEEAQGFCEKGAHQFLRDGDCFSEIEATRKRFSNCAGIAVAEVDRLKGEAEAVKCEASVMEEGEEEKTLVGDATPPDHMETKSVGITSDSKIGPPPIKEVNFAGTGLIEIDDGSDSESVQIDMSAIRRTVRSTRV